MLQISVFGSVTKEAYKLSYEMQFSTYISAKGPDQNPSNYAAKHLPDIVQQRKFSVRSKIFLPFPNTIKQILKF